MNLFHRVFAQPLKKMKQERVVPVSDFEIPGIFAVEMDIKPRMPSPDPIDPYEFDDTSPTVRILCLKKSDIFLLIQAT